MAGVLLLGGSLGAAAPAGPNRPPPGFDPILGPPFDARDRPTLGSGNAPIVVLEVASFQCLHCRAFQERIFPALRDRYITSGQVRWIMLNASDDSAGANGRIFLIGRCTWRAGQFWNVADDLFRMGNQPPDVLDALMAADAAIDPAQLGLCLDDPATHRRVEEDFAEYKRLHVIGTPYFYVRRLRANGQRIEAEIAGYQTVEYFGRVFDRLLQSP
jgi:protein-disulfide isomerase